MPPHVPPFICGFGWTIMDLLGEKNNKKPALSGFCGLLRIALEAFMVGPLGLEPRTKGFTISYCFQ